MPGNVTQVTSEFGEQQSACRDCRHKRRSPVQFLFDYIQTKKRSGRCHPLPPKKKSTVTCVGLMHPDILKKFFMAITFSNRCDTTARRRSGRSPNFHTAWFLASDEIQICARLWYYAAYSYNSVPTRRNNPAVLP